MAISPHMPRQRLRSILNLDGSVRSLAHRRRGRDREHDLIAGLNEGAAAAMQRKELQGQSYWMSAGLECAHNLDVMARMLRYRGKYFSRSL